MVTECEKENVYLLLSTFVAGLLWVLSEIIGSSKCRAGGVFEFMIHGYCIEISRENRIETHTIVESTSLLIDHENVE